MKYKYKPKAPKYKIVPALSLFGQPCFYLYKRFLFLYFRVPNSHCGRRNQAEDLIRHLEGES